MTIITRGLPLRAPLRMLPANVRYAHFDSNAFVRRLENSGIPRKQADVLVAALTDVISESIDNLARGLVRREEAENTKYTQKVCFLHC